MKRILTVYKNKVLNVLWDGSRMIECRADSVEDSFTDSVYAARVDHIVENIDSAFLSAGSIKMYYSLKEKGEPVFVKRLRKDRLTEGDEIIVQVSKNAIKTKEAVASSMLKLSGRYAVIMRTFHSSCDIHFSKKISDEEWKKHIRMKIKKILSEYSGNEIFAEILVRTNAFDADESLILEEVRKLYSQYCSILTTGIYKNAGTCLWKPVPAYIKAVRDTRISELEEVVSDNEDIISQLKQEFDDGKTVIRYYDDKDYSLMKCYSLETALKRALDKNVWLKSGAYLIIERMETLTAVDVNTGKAIRDRDHIFEINKEAAREIFLQLRLRNISGMVIVDFINMDSSLIDEFMAYLRKLAAKDPVRTSVIDMTKLGLVEITRKKITDSLDRQLEI